MKIARAALLLAVVALIVVAVMLPNTEIAAIRQEHRWLSEFINETEHRWPHLDVLHLLMFGGLGFLAGLALADQPWQRLALGLVLFSGVTELMQFAAVGRNARWGDFAQDVAGAWAGLLVAMALVGVGRWLFGKRSRR